MHQVSIRQWPEGLEEDALQIALKPNEIGRRSKIQFECGRDSLDHFLGAVVDLGNGRSVAFQRHLHSPVRGTTVLLRLGETEELKALVYLLQLRRKDIIWTAPHLANQLGSIIRSRYSRGVAGRNFDKSRRQALTKFSQRQLARRTNSHTRSQCEPNSRSLTAGMAW